MDVIAPAASGSAYVLRGAPVLAVPARPKGPATLGDATSGNYFVVVGVGPDEALTIAGDVVAAGVDFISVIKGSIETDARLARMIVVL